MIGFVHETLPGRVVFGQGRLADVQRETHTLGSRALVLCSAGRRQLADRVAELLGDVCVGVHDRAAVHVPYERIVGALARAEALGADVLIAVGGGSAIGLAKGVALEKPLPILAIPTTYAGSEMTPIWGLTRDGHKTTGRDPVVKPRTVICDPELTLTLPAVAAVASGMNAIAHGVEALYAADADPISSLLAEEGVRALAAALPRLLAEPVSIEPRSEAQYGALLTGSVLGGVGMALHHKLCHVLGGSFDLPHAETHSVLLPHVVAFNAPHAEEAMRALARALGIEGADPTAAAEGLFDLQLALGLPQSLSEIGLEQTDLAGVAELALLRPYHNPRPLTSEGIHELLDRAFHGRRPERAAAGRV